MSDQITPGYHVPVMAAEVLEFLAPAGSGLWLDCTLGGGAHSRLIAERLSPEATLLGIDRDPRALAAAREKLVGVPCRVEIRRAHFRDAAALVDELGGRVSGALWDLGLSSNQLDRGAGFSFRDLDAPLDMRQDPDQELTAEGVLNGTPEKLLADLIFRNADERLSRRIAASIAASHPLRTVGDLVGAVERSLPRGYRRRDDVLRRTMMAVRIEVNQELDQLTASLEAVTERLVPGGRMAVLSYHSGEDRLVKVFFRQGRLEGRLRVLTAKPLRPSGEEARTNPRARPARLRAAERLPAPESL